MASKRALRAAGLSLLFLLALWIALHTTPAGDTQKNTQANHLASTTAQTGASGNSNPPANQSKRTIWHQLAQAQPLQTQNRPTSNGSTVRTTLIRQPGKYPRVLVREMVSIDPSTNQKVIENQVAMVADHMLVKRQKGITQANFESTLHSAGMHAIRALSSEGLYIVTFSLDEIDSLDRAIRQLSQTKQVAYAEPDYLVFPTEDLDSRHIVKTGANGIPSAPPNPSPLQSPTSNNNATASVGEVDNSALTKIYQVTWDTPPHTLNRVAAVGGANAPSQINFGTPTVRSSIGTMTEPSLEMKGTGGTLSAGYQQIQFNLKLSSTFYRIEADLYLDQPDEFTLHADSSTGMPFVSRFYANGSNSAFSGTYPLKQVFHLQIDLDCSAQKAELFINGTSRIKTSFAVTSTDINDIRLHLSGSTTTSTVGIDNVVISALGVSSPFAKPQIVAAPNTLTFNNASLGFANKQYLTLQNTGGGTLTITSIASNNSAFYTTETLPITIVGGATYQAAVIFKPTALGTATGTLSVASNDTSTPLSTITLNGYAQSAPNISVASSSLALTMVPGLTGTQSFAIGNIGAGALSWTMTIDPDNNGATYSAITPNDSYFSSLWGMTAPTASTGGIDAVHAWSISTGSSDIKVAVIDSGVDYYHPDLAANIDLANGYNFINETSDPYDDNGHGTHISGTISARGNNSIGVIGVAWNCKIVPLKFLPAAGSGYISDAIQAVNYAASLKIPIINNSWGGGNYSQSLHDAIAASGSLFICSAGNDSLNNDTTPHYPSSYDCANILSIASTTPQDTYRYTSNYGVTSVDLGAPGESIYSTYPGNDYASLSGTSMATPHASGAAALLLSKNPRLTPLQIKQVLMDTADVKPALAGKTLTGARLNVFAALRQIAPSWITPLSLSGTINGYGSTTVPINITSTDLSYGSYTANFTIKSSDPAHSTIQIPVSLLVANTSPLNTWRMKQFGINNILDNTLIGTVWDDTADPNHNGLPNLLEYALGLDPKQANSSSVRHDVQTGSDGKSYLILSYVCPYPTPSDLTYTVETSADLQTWKPAVTETNRVNNGNGTQTVTSRSNDPINAVAPQSFIRLKVAH